MQELGDKFRGLDEYVKDLNFKQDSLQQFTEKVRMDLAQIIVSSSTTEMDMLRAA